MGNITAVKKGTRANMSALSDYRAYTYDAKGELTGETIYSGGSSTQRTYAYDGLGNLTSQTQTGVLGNKSISYTYGTSSSAGWGKMLNSVSVTENGNTTTENIVYDAIGNPTTYRNASLTWFGRQLTAYSKSGTSASFTYDADGLRGKKTVNGTTSTYQYVNGHLAYEKRGNVQYFYFYDSFGKLSSIRFYDPSVSNGSAQNYFTLTNQQGDVVAIYNVAGTKVASYEYDAWGNIISTTDTSGVSISTRNPFRYRGYYYDQETGLYYLQSRYYDPEIGRFINADSQLNGTSVIGCNVYSYCENNPVNRNDPMGTCLKTAWSWVKNTVNRIWSKFKQGLRLEKAVEVKETPPSKGLPYNSRDEAAIVSARTLQGLTEATNIEWGESIVYDSTTNTYGLTGLIAGKHDRVSFYLPDNYELAGFVHSHPYCNGHVANSFSEVIINEDGTQRGDAYVAFSYSVPIYLASPNTGDLYCLVPGSTVYDYTTSTLHNAKLGIDTEEYQCN